MAATDDTAPKLPAAFDAPPHSGPVECLGLTFESDDARREHFLARLKEKLPELRQRPDFPVAEDEDILRLSDPPYYTACPNPFLAEFVEHTAGRTTPTSPITASRSPSTSAPARPTRSTGRTATTPRCRIWRSSRPSCITRGPATSSSTASAARA